MNGVMRVSALIIQIIVSSDTIFIKNPEEPIIAWLTSILRLLTLVGFFVLPLYLLVWAISCKIFVPALILAYLEAWLWSKVADKMTTLVQELYLVMSTVGYTVLIGTAIQLNRMPWAGSTILGFYWILLLILGGLIWHITICRVTELAGYQPGFKINKIEYKQYFRSTQIAEIPPTDKAQAYLKRMR